MQRLAQWLLVAALTLTAFGCAHNPFNIPRESYEQKVKVLGVTPIFLDADSDLRHPEKEALLALVREFNRKNEKELVAMLKDSGAYFAVRSIDTVDPDQLYRTLIYRNERRDDAGVVYNKQFYKTDEIRNLIARNNVDAVLLVVVSGLTKRDRIYSCNLLKYLDADYNDLIMTAQVLDANGVTLWEYPNFRVGGPTTPVLAELQYPDFDEAAANMDERVDVKFKTIPGLARFLGQKEKDLLFRERKATAPYYRLFDDMVGILKPPMRLFGDDKQQAVTPAPAPPAPVTPAVQPAVQPAQPVATPAPASAAPAPAPADTTAIPEPAPIREVPIDTK